MIVGALDGGQWRRPPGIAPGHGSSDSAAWENPSTEGVHDAAGGLHRRGSGLGAGIAEVSRIAASNVPRHEDLDVVGRDGLGVVRDKRRLQLDQIMDLAGRDATSDERTLQRLLGREMRKKGRQPRR